MKQTLHQGMAALLVFALATVCQGAEPTGVPEVADETIASVRELPVAESLVHTPVAAEAAAQEKFEIAATPGDDKIIEVFAIGGLQLQEKNSLVPIFEKGGPIMWPLLFASILALGTVLDRLIFLFTVRSRRDKKAMERFFAAVAKSDHDEAIRVANETKYYVVRTLGYALQHKEKSLPNALIFAQEQEMKRFRRGIPILDTVITLAPLLGLLGTVTGMMASFSLIGGELSAPGAITGGIAEALIATAFGLGIAITSLLPFNYLNNKMEEAQLEIQSAATQLEMLTLTKAEKTPEPKTVRPRRRAEVKEPELVFAEA